VNLDSRSHITGIYGHNSAVYFPHPNGHVIKKVAIVLRDTHIPGALSKAARAGVEELRLECQDGGCPNYTYATPSPSSSSSYNVNLSLDMLPLTSLRVLDLTGCKLSLVDDLREYYQPPLPFSRNSGEPPLPHTTFPCLEALRLRRCATSLDMLQTMVDGAPRLADLRLESLGILPESFGPMVAGGGDTGHVPLPVSWDTRDGQHPHAPWHSHRRLRHPA
jgi:hypothetical protein